MNIEHTTFVVFFLGGVIPGRALGAVMLGIEVRAPLCHACTSSLKALSLAFQTWPLEAGPHQTDELGKWMIGFAIYRRESVSNSRFDMLFFPQRSEHHAI